MITGLKIWLGLVVFVMTVYAIRHFVFAFVRLYLPQRHSYQDISRSYLPAVCVMVPMHNEMLVVHQTVAALQAIDYPRNLIEIVIIDDRSTDGTGVTLDTLCAASPHIEVLHRTGENGNGGAKPAALNEALQRTNAEVILTFDADYWPSRDACMRLVAPMVDPRVALTMGRVVPRNASKNLLTRMLDLERAGGYQVNQQARHTLGLLPQYGGTVGAIRRSFLASLGGWDASCLAEDTYLTVQAYIHGLLMVYVNLEETTEEVPVTWPIRQKQLRRWVIGHNQVASRLSRDVVRSPFLTGWQKIDALMMLCIYAATMLQATGYPVAILLLLLGEGLFAGGGMAVLILTTYSTMGNAAAFIEIAVSAVLDGRPRALWGLPLLTLHFVGSAFVVAAAMLDWMKSEFLGRRDLIWHKTTRAGEA